MFLGPRADAASATTILRSGTELRVLAAPGEPNSIRLTQDAEGVHFRDDGAPLAAAKGSSCSSGAGEVVCAAGGVGRVRVRLGDQGDTFAASDTFAIPITVHGGPGRDYLSGGAARDQLFGEAAADRLDASWRGGDELAGGAGDDDISINNLPTSRGRGNRIACGGGLDELRFANAPDQVALDCELISVYRVIEFPPLAPDRLPNRRRRVLSLRAYSCEQRDCSVAIRVVAVGDSVFKYGTILAKGGVRGETHGYRRVPVYLTARAWKRFQGSSQAIRVRVRMTHSVGGKTYRDGFYTTLGVVRPSWLSG
jgi:hypothetical protein